MFGHCELLLNQWNVGFCIPLISPRGCIAFDQVMINTENTKMVTIYSYKMK